MFFNVAGKLLCGAFYITVTQHNFIKHSRVLLREVFELYKYPVHMLLGMISGMKYTTKVKSGISIPNR